jgi:two-component system phosphate regulon response regulator PhoB
MANKILAVDDENDILLIVKTALESEGFEVEAASSGEDALAIIENFAPDCIVLDMMMPGLDGLATLEQFRRRKNTQRTPVIMLTGVSERGKIVESLNKGIAYYIVKPFECDDLINKVNTAINETKGTVA